MGVLNVTPDSFSDGGRHHAPDAALAAAEAMVSEGADLIDVGGESTRPGATPVDGARELGRVLPVIEALVRHFDVPVSIDTGKAEVMRAAVGAGASLINDVYALRLPGALEAAAELGVPVCLMHMLGEPRTMQRDPQYSADPLADVTAFLLGRVAACAAAGIPRERLVLDPGFGFGKKLEHNLALLRGLRHLAGLGFPVLAGLSRKSLLGELTRRPVGERLHGSVALAVYAALNGAAILRVHDVGPTVDALRAIEPIRGSEADG
jgi:dihydropteroate synthase